MLRILMMHADDTFEYILDEIYFSQHYLFTSSTSSKKKKKNIEKLRYIRKKKFVETFLFARHFYPN